MEFRKERLSKPYPQTLDAFFTPEAGKIGQRLIALNQTEREGIPEPFRDLVHVGVVDDWPAGIHSTGKGVHRIENIIEHYPDAVILRHKALNGEAASSLRNKIRGDMLALCDEKRKYDFLSIIAFAMVLAPTLVRKFMRRYNPNFDELYLFCSELVVRSLRKRGVPVVDSINPECISPGRLAMDPAWIYVGRAHDFIDLSVRIAVHNITREIDACFAGGYSIKP